MSKAWKVCALCSIPNESPIEFQSPLAFGDHLRLVHSKNHNGLYICQYGRDAICPDLLNEPINDQDFETHLAKCHIFAKHNSHQSTYRQNSNNSQQNGNNSTASISDTNNRRNNGFTTAGDYIEDGYWSSNRNGKKCSLFTPTFMANPNFPAPQKSSRFDYNSHSDECTSNNSISSNNSSTNSSNNYHSEPEWTVYSSSQILASSINDPSKARNYYDNLFTKDWGFTFIECSVTPYPTMKKPPKNLMLDSYIKRVNRRTKVLSHRPALSREPSRDEIVSVPKMLFDESFDLSDSDTFGSLLELFGFDRSDDSLAAFFQQSEMSHIQTRLSEYLDVVEQDLASQIGKRSKDFFQVMSSMDSVMEKLMSCIRQVSTIRESCSHLDDYLVRPVGQNIVLTRTRNVVKELLEKINWIATVHQAQPTIQLLLSKSDYAGALDLISTSQECVTQELSGVICFRHLKLQLMEIERVIEQMMNQEFVKYLTAEWNRPTESKTFSIEEEKLLSIIYGMLKLQKFNFIDTFREEAFTAIKTNVKQTVIEALSSDDSIEVSRMDLSVIQQTKLLPFSAWISFLQRLFERLVTLLRRVSSVYSVISDGFEMVSASVQNNRSKDADKNDDRDKEDEENGEDKIILHDDYQELKENLKEILYSVCDFANSRCAQIIELKVNDGTLDRLDSTDFMHLIHCIQTFTDECEILCKKKSPNLKLVIQLQSNKLLKKFHDERKDKQMQLLNLEQWKPVTNLSEQFQTLCSELVSISDGQGLVVAYQKFMETRNNRSNKSANLIILDGQKFVLVNAVINLLYSVLDYCEYAANIPYLASDFLARLIDLLKYFNARTSQLVLGAVAIQSAGLKTITARNLVICARALAFVVHLIPSLKIHFEALFRIDDSGKGRQISGVTTKHLDEVIQLYENHYTNISDKILNIVREVVGSNMSKWVAKAPIPSMAFQSISNHLKRLHDNIQEFISESELIQLFENIHTIIIEGFREQLAELKIVNDGGPQHGLVTQELTFYIQSLNNLSIGSKLKLSMVELWPNQ